MDSKGLLHRTYRSDALGYDEHYYRFIFKKTEKIVCAVFYITSDIKDLGHREHIVKDTEASALGLLESAHASLAARREEANTGVEALQYALIELESKLRILHAAQLLSEELLNVFVGEIDTVLRTSNAYKQGTLNPLFEREDASIPAVSSRERPFSDKSTEPLRDRPASTQASQQRLPNRRGRILSVLRDKGQASIKDITEMIKDCSEKTIQRELNAMIKDGIVKREGERRWSRYTATI